MSESKEVYTPLEQSIAIGWAQAVLLNHMSRNPAADVESLRSLYLQAIEGGLCIAKDYSRGNP